MDQSLLNADSRKAGESFRQGARSGSLKRYGFLLSWLPALLLILSGWIAHVTGDGAWLWLLVAAAFIGIPMVDQVVGRDTSNPAPAGEQSLKTDRYYVHLMYGSVLLHWFAFLFMAWVPQPLHNAE